jgi:putative phosphoribosyl transferase
MEPREDGFGYYESSGAGALFRDRADAGAQLADELLQYRGRNPLVLGIPRGGVPVAYEIARRLEGDLDVIVARKMGAPGQEELGIGAVASDGSRYVSAKLRTLVGISDTELEHLAQRELAEAQRREARFRAGLDALHPAGRIVIVVDDGLATGATMRAAIRSLRSRGAEHVVVAVPVGAPDTCRTIAREVDQLVCPHQPDPFYSVGNHYRKFDQTSDEEVEQLLHKQRAAVRTSNALETQRNAR